MISFCTDLITILALTLWVWAWLGCLCYKEAVRRYLDRVPFQKFLALSVGCFSTVTSMPLLQMIVTGTLGQLCDSFTLPHFLFLLPFLLFWFWPYLLLVEGLRIVDALHGHTPYKLNFFFVLTLCMMCYLMWASFFFISWQ